MSDTLDKNRLEETPGLPTPIATRDQLTLPQPIHSKSANNTLQDHGKKCYQPLVTLLALSLNMWIAFIGTNDRLVHHVMVKKTWSTKGVKIL